MNPLLPDAPDRTLAATCFDRNLVVEAGAGTGKTSLLVERYLNQLLSGRVDQDGIVAITFTEKAATEMKIRVAAALAEIVRAAASGDAAAGNRDAAAAMAWLIAEEGVTLEALHRRALDALDGLESAFIGTIHAFAADLLRRHPVEAGIPSEFTVDAGFAQDLLFDDLWPEFLAAELGPGAPRGALWSRVLTALGEEEIEEVARALVRSPAACDHLARAGSAPPDEREVFGEAATRLRDRLAADLPAIQSANLIGQVTTALRLLEAFLAGGIERMRAAEHAGPDLEKFWKKRDAYAPGKGLERGVEIQAGVVEALALLRDLRRTSETVIAPLLEALAPFAGGFRDRIVREGILSFEDLLLLARNLLRDCPKARAREGGRTRAILVDEFQDTDPLQYEILFLLAGRAGGLRPDPYDVSLEPGRLFIVGDPKQSIYRFRGADMAAFVRARDRVLAGTGAAALSANFRSVEEILMPLNRLFATWMRPASPEEREVEPEYAPIHAWRGPAGDGPRIELWSVASPRPGAEVRRRAEAESLAGEIADLVSRGGVPPREIAVLLRALTDLPVYARALREAEVDFVVDGGKAFSQRSEIVEALALLQAIGNPADPVALLGVLRSPWGGVPDAELFAFAREGGRFQATRPLPTAATRFPTVTRAFERLAALEEERRRLPLDRWIRSVLTTGDLPLLAAAHADGPQRVANLRKLGERAAVLALERGLPLEATVRILEEEFTGDRLEGESPLADEALEAVRVMSIHKAKGLEFRVVFLPDVGRGTPPNRFRTRVRLCRVRGRPAVAVDVADRGGLRNAAATAAAREDAHHERAEMKRLLYVAATRAKDRLVVVNTRTQRPGPWLKALSEAWGYDVGGWPADRALLAEGGVLHRRFSGAAERRPTSPGAVLGIATAVTAAARAAAKASAPRPPRVRNPSRDHRVEATERADATEAGPLFTRDRDLARAAGVAVHRLLEGWEIAEPASLLERAAGEAERAARERGADPVAVAREVRAILRGFLDSPLPDRLARAEILGREVPVLRRDPSGAVVFGYLDLLYRLEGEVHVADYKTDTADSPALAERYRGQLEDYAVAVETALGLERLPVMEILFVRTGARVPLLPGDPR